MTEPQMTPPPSADPAARRQGLVFGMFVLALIVLVVGLWRVFGPGHGHNGAGAIATAFEKQKPQIVSISAEGAPVLTADDVASPFFALNQVTGPAEADRDTAKAFAANAPQQVWLLAAPAWAAEPARSDLAAFFAHLKQNNIAAVLILPPQGDEAADEVIDTLAAAANDAGATFLDYHDAAKLSGGDCASDDASVTTQKMLLQMGINAPTTREHLKLADIAARIQAACGGDTGEDAGAAAGDDKGTDAPEDSNDDEGQPHDTPPAE